MPPEVEAGAPGAYGGAGLDRRHGPGQVLDQPARRQRSGRASACRRSPITRRSPATSGRANIRYKLPLIRSLLAFNAYSEGWALYAEQLADELGVYDDDPVGRLGYLQSIAFRACRLVVDTGLHAKRWTREQAIDWFATPTARRARKSQSEVDRYCAWPGQACGYKVGHSEINRLRERAKAALGQRYDLRDFNDAVVLGGNVPMTVLERVIDRHVAERRGGRPKAAAALIAIFNRHPEPVSGSTYPRPSGECGGVDAETSSA